MAMILRLRLRNRNRAGQVQRRARAGMSIVEIVVALTLFGTVGLSMAGLSLVVARRAEANDLFTKRTALLQQQMNWLQALPYDSLMQKEGKFVVEDGAFPHARYVSFTPMGSRTLVSIQVIPTRAPDNGETVEFYRAKPATSPLCSGC
jgi:type II secretory pathway pseudopilin PulG